jgi:hypothetical protein
MAGGKANAFDNALLLLIFNGTTIAGIAQNVTASPLTSYQLALHTADPGVGGDQTASEATYGGYARTAVARSTAGFTVSGASVTLAAAVNFPAPTSGAGQTLVYFSLGVAASGASMILYRGPITPNIVITVGTPPQLTTGTTITEG